MASILRRIVGARSISHRPLVVHHQKARTYASHSEEPVDYDLDHYPKLPDVSKQYLPPFGWQDQQLRRNFGDPVGLLHLLTGCTLLISSLDPRKRGTLLYVGS